MVLASTLAGGAQAATITVKAASGFSGLGLEVVVGPTCTSPDTLDLSAPAFPTLNDEYEACVEIDAADTEVVLPGATLRAGQGIVLGANFTVASGATLTSVLEASLATDYAWVEDRSPFQEIRYNARFYQRLNGLTIGSSDSLQHLVGYAPGGTPEFRLLLEKDPVLGNNLLALEAREDGGAWVATPAGQELVLPAGWVQIEIQWGAGDGDGFLLAAVDGGPLAGLSSLSNGSVRIDSIRWGAVGGAIGGTSGALEMDEFESWR